MFDDMKAALDLQVLERPKIAGDTRGECIEDFADANGDSKQVDPKLASTVKGQKKSFKIS